MNTDVADLKGFARIRMELKILKNDLFLSVKIRIFRVIRVHAFLVLAMLPQVGIYVYAESPEYSHSSLKSKECGLSRNQRMMNDRVMVDV